MTRTATLRQQHDIILDKAIVIQSMARDLEEPHQIAAILREFRRFDGVLTAHLVSEDEFLYPEMAASSDPMTSNTASRFCEEMGGLSATYRAFADKWLDEAKVLANPDGFRAAFTKIVFALSDRIHRENSELYPLADVMQDETPLVASQRLA